MKTCVNLTRKQFNELVESEFEQYQEYLFNFSSEFVVYKLEKPSLLLRSLDDLEIVKVWKQLVKCYEVVRHYLNDSGYNPFSSGSFKTSFNLTSLDFKSFNLASGLYIDARMTQERNIFYTSKANGALALWVVNMCEEVKEAIRDKFSTLPGLEEILDTLTFGFKDHN